MTVPLSLIRRQNHAAALSAMGILNDTRFPTTTQCPKCAQQTLRVFSDDPADGLWLSCETCKSSGNIVTFAAQVWNTGAIDAVNQFVALGVISRDEASRGANIESKIAAKAAAGADFWTTAVAQTWSHGNEVILTKLQELQLDHDLPGVDELVGVATWQQVVELHNVFGAEPPKKWRQGSPCLVFKFNDMPERISGFLFMQYNDEFQARHFFLPAHNPRNTNKIEAGYYLFQRAFLQNAELHNCVFIVDDVFWVLNAQIVQIKYGLPQLPICASYHNDKITSTGRNWAAFPHAPRFFYSDTTPAATISQACMSRGYACLPLNKNMYYARGKPLKTLFKLASIRRHGEPWKDALATLIADVNVLQARAIGQHLTIPPDKIQLFCATNNVPKPIADQLLVEVLSAPVVQMEAKQYVLEKDGKWVTGTGRHIADGIIRITEVLQNDSGEQTYRGYVQIDGQHIEFSERAALIDRMGLLNYLRYKVGQRGILFVFDKQWNKKAAMAAMQIHRPRFVQISEKIGWCEDAAEFQFSNYTITNTGAVVLKEYANDKHKTFPAPTVAAPISINAVLTPAHEHAAIWAGFAAITANIVAPIGNKSFTSVAITNHNYLEVVAKIGQQLDCPFKKLFGLSGAIKIANTASWPHVLDAPYDRKRLIDTIIKHQHAPILMKTHFATAISATTYGWNALHADTPMPYVVLDFLPYLLPAYIQNVLRKRMTLAAHDNFMLAVLRDLHAWLRDNYGATFNLASAEASLWTPACAPDLIMSFIADGVDNGEIDILPRPRKKDQAQNYILKNDKYWWINEHFLTRNFNEKCGLAPNWDFVQNALDTMQVFLGKNMIHHMAGFNVKPEWASSFVFRKNKKIG